MLSAIYKGNVEAYKDGQNPILHLTSSFEAVEEAGLPLCFNDGHAEMAISDFFADTDRLDKVDWDIMKATYWRSKTMIAHVWPNSCGTPSSHGNWFR